MLGAERQTVGMQKKRLSRTTEWFPLLGIHTPAEAVNSDARHGGSGILAVLEGLVSPMQLGHMQHTGTFTVRTNLK